MAVGESQQMQSIKSFAKYRLEKLARDTYFAISSAEISGNWEPRRIMGDIDQDF